MPFLFFERRPPPGHLCWRQERERLAAISENAQTPTSSITAGRKAYRDPEFAKAYLPQKAALLAVLSNANQLLLAEAHRAFHGVQWQDFRREPAAGLKALPAEQLRLWTHRRRLGR